jgi:capsule polysaccharide export protein KpsE/RkpR
VLKAESKIKTMNKLTTKENIEKAAEEYILNSYENSVSVKKMTIGFANRVLEDMQEEVDKAKDEMIEYRNRVMGLQTLYDMNTEKIETITTKLTTTRADTLKEVLEIIDGIPMKNQTYDILEAHINSLLNQKP